MRQFFFFYSVVDDCECCRSKMNCAIQVVCLSVVLLAFCLPAQLTCFFPVFCIIFTHPDFLTIYSLKCVSFSRLRSFDLLVRQQVKGWSSEMMKFDARDAVVSNQVPVGVHTIHTGEFIQEYACKTKV